MASVCSGTACSAVSPTAPAIIATGALLAMFAMLFGTHRYELAGRSEGLVYSIGLESLVKLAALVLVAAIAFKAILASPVAAARGFAMLAKGFRPDSLTPDFPVIIVISAMAIVVLPRQFYMGLVEAQQPDDVVKARFGLAGYLAAMAVLIMPIALAGVALAVAWDLLISPSRSLASFGLVAFAAMAQFTAHLILAAYGRGRDPLAARASLMTALVIWLYTLALPPIVPTSWLGLVSGGPLDPLRLLGIDLGSPLVHGVIWSLGTNLAVMGDRLRDGRGQWRYLVRVLVPGGGGRADADDRDDLPA